MDMNNMVFEIKDYTVVRNGYRTTEKRLDTIQECIEYIRKNMKKTYTNNVNLSYWIMRNYKNEEIAPVLLAEIISFAGLDAYEKAEQEKTRLEAEQIIKRLEAEQEKARLEAEQEKARLEVIEDRTIKQTDIARDVFIVNDNRYYSNINDALNDITPEKAIEYYTLPFWSTGYHIIREANKSRWIRHGYLLVADNELVAFEIDNTNPKRARHDISMIRELVFFTKRLTAGENIHKQIAREYKERRDATL